MSGLHKERFEVHPDSQCFTQEELTNWVALEWYLHRTTLFWNYLIFYLDDSLELRNYLETGTSKAAEDLVIRVKTLTEEIQQSSLKLIPRPWQKFASAIQQLPSEILNFRAVELVSVYEAVRNKRVTGVDIGIPRRKNSRSRQSIRMPLQEGIALLEGDRLKVQFGTPGIVLRVPGLDQQDRSRLPESISITRSLKRVEDAHLGPLPDHYYTVILHY